MAKTYNLYLQFEPNSNFDFWVKSLSDEIQQAKDKTWQNNNQILIWFKVNSFYWFSILGVNYSSVVMLLYLMQ